MNDLRSTGILIISHGSPRQPTNEGFQSLVGRIAARLGIDNVLPAFFSIARPDIFAQVAELSARGVRHIVMMPYFLYTGQHVTTDIPALLDDCRVRFPNLTIELLPTLENDPALEDLVVERLTPFAAANELPTEGAAIERRSYEIIDRQLAFAAVQDPAAQTILRRVIHATADVSFGRTLRIHPEAVARGIEAIRANKPVLCDVRMLQAGITKAKCEVLCVIDHPDVAAEASAAGCTRAAAAIEKFRPMLDGAIVAVGNAPTALWKLMEMAGQGGPRPALVVGMPVGFVGARESKLALAQSNLCFITNTSARGGSPVAAAVVNALAGLAYEEQRS